jgi:probable F420-dependent oxidoreductase
MRINFQMPSRAIKHYERWIGGHELSVLAVAAEEAGFDAVSMTDHPFPPDEWLAAGGHQAFDPFVALAVIGARTSRIRLLTNLVVAGYRSPYITAKAAASVDVLSGGRLVLGMGAGYVEGEFAALGADFRGRGVRFDAALTAIGEAWDGRSVGHSALPRPERRPPIWIGGNSRRARRRAATDGDGWMPFGQGAEQAAITGTDSLTSVEQLADRIADLDRMRRELGRPEPLDVCFAPPGVGSAEAFLAFLDSSGAACAEAGVTWLTWESSARSADACLADIGSVGSAIAGLEAVAR